MSSGSVIDTAASVTESVAVIIAAGVAIYGISAWRREHVGRKRIDTAEEILAAFYAARDAFEHVRGSFGFAGQGQTRKRADNESAEESEILDRAYVAIERLKVHSEEFAKLRALRYRALAFWGTEAAKPFDSFERINSEIITAARMLPAYWRPQSFYANSAVFEQRDQQRRKLEAKMWSGGEDDVLTTVVGEMVLQAEELCRPVIEDQQAERGVSMNAPSKENQELLQRDKEMRTGLLTEFFARLLWLDAAATAAIVAFLAEHPTAKPSAISAGTWAAAAFGASLVVSLFLPLRRAEASFDRGKKDWLSWTMQYVAASLAAAGVVAIVVGIFCGLNPSTVVAPVVPAGP
jgi:hypothetical protein